ncbi:MAG: DUF3291 domain-containing protein [Actinobacteria bacterium]|nr:DUF3291 domain-containing protein [Actinomycetota bacterium]
MNLSVWRDLEALRAYVIGNAGHRSTLSGPPYLVRPGDRAHDGLLVRRRGAHPDARGGRGRLLTLRADGPSADLFAFSTAGGTGLGSPHVRRLCRWHQSRRPLSGLVVGELTEGGMPEVGDRPRAGGEPHRHDVFSLTGQALAADRLPMILGRRVRSHRDGREVIVHAVVGDVNAGRGDETLDARRGLFSEVDPARSPSGVRVPAGNLVDKPAELSFEEDASPPDRLAHGLPHDRREVRDGARRHDLGPGCRGRGLHRPHRAGHRAGPTGPGDVARDAREAGPGPVARCGSGVRARARLPERVAAVMGDGRGGYVGALVEGPSPGQGRVVISGATSGANPPADLNRVFFLQLSIVGSTTWAVQELRDPRPCSCEPACDP